MQIIKSSHTERQFKMQASAVQSIATLRRGQRWANEIIGIARAANLVESAKLDGGVIFEINLSTLLNGGVSRLLLNRSLLNRSHMK